MVSSVQDTFPKHGTKTSNLILDRSMQSWYDKAGVRNDPRRMIGEEQNGEFYWPPQLAPFVNHPLVAKLEKADAAKHELLIRQLYHYLQFTSNYELRVINRATDLIATGRSGVPLSTQVRLDAFKIYTDEGYHALYSVDAIHQVEKRTGVQFNEYDFDNFLNYLSDVKGQLPELKGAVELLVVIIFETFITGSLTQVPKDNNVVSLVREIVTDHAEDEAHHHAFFSGFFPLLWGQLTVFERTKLGKILPQLIVRPLEPAIPIIHQSLLGVGLSDEEARHVIEDTYPRDEVMAGIRKSARSTMNLFAKYDLFEDKEIRNSFEESGLILPKDF